MIAELAALGIGLAGGLFVRSLIHGPRCRFSGQCRVAAVGDSITAGEHYVRALGAALPRYTFTAFGDVGAGLEQVLTNLRRNVLPGGYDEIVIEAGLNSISWSDEEMLAGLEALVREAKASGARVVLLSLTPWRQAPQRIAQLNSRLRWLAPLWGADAFVDVWTPLADTAGGLRSGYIGDAAMHVHPNRSGHEAMAQAILRKAY